MICLITKEENSLRCVGMFSFCPPAEMFMMFRVTHVSETSLEVISKMCRD